MSPTRSIRTVLVSNAIEQLAFRFTQVALPLVVLAELDSAAAAGLLGGAAGLPVVTSPWWARRLRQRVADGRGLALVSLCQGLAVLALPASLLALGGLNVPLLAVVGLAVGVADALGSPGRTALLGDLGDELGAGAATKAVTWDDAVRRAAMVAGPAMAGLGVHLGWTHALLWVEGVALLVSAGLVRTLVAGRTTEPPGRTHCDAPAPGILESVRRHPDVLRGWVMRGTSCLVWFSFSLGLAVLGQRTGQAGTLYATALTAYGVGALATTLAIASRPVARRPIRLATGAWVGQGLAFAAMSFWTTPVPVAVCSALAGTVTVVGIRAMTQVLLVQMSGAPRRAALAGQSVLVDVTSSTGLLVGGLVLDRVGPQTVLLVAGLATAGVAVVAGSVRRPRPAPVRTYAVRRETGDAGPAAA